MRGQFKIICGFWCILVIFPDTFNNAFKALESGILTSWTRKCGPLGIWGGGAYAPFAPPLHTALLFTYTNAHISNTTIII